MKKVLFWCKQIDPILLDLLTYPQQIKIWHKATGEYERIHNSALKMAVDEGNNRNVDIILSYMAQINFNSSSNFSNIFPKLIEYDSFKDYLTNLPVQTR